MLDNGHETHIHGCPRAQGPGAQGPGPLGLAVAVAWGLGRAPGAPLGLWGSRFCGGVGWGWAPVGALGVAGVWARGGGGMSDVRMSVGALGFCGGGRGGGGVFAGA